MSRVFLVAVIAFSAFLVLYIDVDPRFVFSVCFALLTASLFPALVCKLWIKNFSQVDIIIGAFSGFVLTATTLGLSHFGLDFIALNGDEIVFKIPQITNDIRPMSMGLIGMVFSFGATLLSSVYFKARAKAKITNETKSDVPA
jgi:Na+(H+)/acetate symporter ActP